MPQFTESPHFSLGWYGKGENPPRFLPIRFYIMHWFGHVKYFDLYVGGKMFSFRPEDKEQITGSGYWTGFDMTSIDGKLMVN